MENGTVDKLFIDGPFYSDKPPTLTLYLAAVYWLMKSLTGVTPSQHPHVFIYVMTLAR